MDQTLNNYQTIPKKVLSQAPKQIAIIQLETADDYFWSAKITHAINNLKEQGHRVDWYWYPATLAAADFQLEIEDLKPHYDEVIIVPGEDE